MLNKTHGIVLHHIKFGDNGLIIHVFTKENGRRSFLFQGLKGKKNKGKKNYFQPLYLLEIEYYERKNSNLQRIKEVKILHPLLTIPFDIRKSTISVFLAEVLFKSLKTEEPSYMLFDFIQQSIQMLDTVETDFANFHLLFLLGLSRILGVYPNLHGMEQAKFFDLKEGVFLSVSPHHTLFLKGDDVLIFKQLLQLKYETMNSLKLSRVQRSRMLEYLIDYYKLHEVYQGGIKSYEILRELFN